MSYEEIPVRRVTLWLCDLCLDGAGGQCHTPGCALWINRAPDLPLRNSPMVTVHDKLSAALEEIKANQRLASDASLGFSQLDERHDAVIKAAYLDLPLVLAVVDALLKPHQPGRNVVFGDVCKRHEAHRHFSITDIEAAGVRDCPDCTATVYVSCAGCGPQVSLDQCPVRKTITRGLTREGKSDG